MADSFTLGCEELLNKFSVSIELKNEQRIAITSLLRGSDLDPMSLLFCRRGSERV